MVARSGEGAGLEDLSDPPRRGEGDGALAAGGLDLRTSGGARMEGNNYRDFYLAIFAVVSISMFFEMLDSASRNNAYAVCVTEHTPAECGPAPWAAP